MLWKLSLKLVCTTLLVWPTAASARMEGPDFLPGVSYHMERARVNMQAGRLSLAMAHTQLILHDQGLRVYIDLSDTPEPLREVCRKAALRSMQYWNDTLGAGSLVEVDTLGASEVQIVYHQDVFLNGKAVGGYCAQSRQIATKGSDSYPDYSAEIKARFRLPNGSNLNEECLTNIVTHELGHVYGLEDCNDKGHLMSALNPSRPKTDLHADEMEALKQLRLTFFEIQRSIMAKSKGN